VTGPPEFLTVAEVAALWRVSPRTVRRMVGDGTLPFIQLGPRTTRIRRDVAEAAMHGDAPRATMAAVHYLDRRSHP
jgi:excisionase family DNA binding protein